MGLSINASFGFLEVEMGIYDIKDLNSNIQSQEVSSIHECQL